MGLFNGLRRFFNPTFEEWLGEDIKKLFQDLGKEDDFTRVKGCLVLFKSDSGIIICGEKRADGNCFLCVRCLRQSLTKECKR